MSFNPYEAPRAPEAGGPEAPIVPGAPQPWEAAEVLGIGWEAVKRHWPVLVFAPLVSGMIASVPSYIPTVIAATSLLPLGSTSYWIVYGICTTAGLALNLFFQVGQIRIFVAAARGQPPDFGQIFAGAGRFLPLLGAMLLTMIAVLGGMLALVVPGVIVSLGLSLAQFYCVEAEMGVVESLQASWEATKGQKGALFVFGLISIAVMLLGLAACCIGMYVALPVVMVAMATIYLRLSGRMGAAPAWLGAYGGPGNWPPPGGGFGYGPPPGGGFGPPPGGGFGAPPAGYGAPPGGGLGAPPAGYGPPPGGGLGAPPAGYGPPPGGGFGAPPAGYGAPPGGGFGPPPGGGFGAASPGPSAPGWPPPSPFEPPPRGGGPQGGAGA